MNDDHHDQEFQVFNCFLPTFFTSQVGDPQDMILLKMGHPGLFCLFLSFQTNITFLQYTVLGFEPTTYKT